MSNIVDLRITRFNANISALIRSESIPRYGNVEIDEGGILELICSAAGRPKPEIYWFKNGRLIIPQKSLQNTFITSEGETSILQLKNVNSWNSGNYACRAENINGHIKKWVNLIVRKEDKNRNIPSLSLTENSLHYNNSNSNLVICQSNYCQFGACYFDSSRLKCNCFTSKQSKALPGIHTNINMTTERSFENKCNQVGCYSFNDQIFTIFETILVCLVTMLLFGIMFFLWRNKRQTSWTRRMGSFTKTTQMNLIGTIKVRDVSINTDDDICEIFPERLYHIPIDRIMTIACCHQHFKKSLVNDHQPEIYTKSCISESLKYPNLKYKPNNLNSNSYYRTCLPEINYEESSLNFDDTQPLNRVKIECNNCLSPCHTISTFSGTGYMNSLNLASEIIQQAESPLSTIEYN